MRDLLNGICPSGARPDHLGDPWPIALLPCLPKEWPQGELNGVRCRGGFEVDITWSDHKLQSVKITSLRGQPCRIQYGALTKDLHLEKDSSARLSGELRQKS